MGGRLEWEGWREIGRKVRLGGRERGWEEG